jgi:hypothetical protein
MGIELSHDEIDRYLNAAPRGILCVTRDGHAPLALPMGFAWVAPPRRAPGPACRRARPGSPAG